VRASSLTSALPRATAVTRNGEPADTVTLDHHTRQRRRLRLVADRGTAFLLDLPKARHLREGDLLRLDDGRLIAVRAALEPVLDITAADHLTLARLAWHLGNRHTPTQVLPDRLRIGDDHVLAAMLEGLGARIERRTAPFEPEGGAYGRHDGNHHHD
jgi:urease accessory protein